MSEYTSGRQKDFNGCRENISVIIFDLRELLVKQHINEADLDLIVEHQNDLRLHLEDLRKLLIRNCINEADLSSIKMEHQNTITTYFEALLSTIDLISVKLNQFLLKHGR